MKGVRHVFSNLMFEHSILTKLIFNGHSIGTFVKDGAIFHRCLITHINRDSNTISGRWLGMQPSHKYIDGFKGEQLFDIRNMEWKDGCGLDVFYLSNIHIVYLPSNVQAEDEILVHQYGNPYASGLCPLR
jgi:hypothetical protein